MYSSVDKSSVITHTNLARSLVALGKKSLCTSALAKFYLDSSVPRSKAHRL